MKGFRPLRQFIFDRLYHPKEGYFCKKDFQLGQMSSTINFKSLIGYDDYQRQLYQKYPKNAWLTPSQIFKPYYGMTIANYISQAHQRLHPHNFLNNKITIVQAGAGTGSAAQSILYFFQNYQANMLANLQYNIVEISPVLCEKIEEKLTKAFPKLMARRQIKIWNENIVDFKSPKQIYGIFCQVLDNLPHDRLVWDGKNYSRYTTIDFNTKQERLQSIQKDQLIVQCLKIYLETNSQKEPSRGILDKMANLIVKKMKNNKQSSEKCVYLPTYLLKMFRSLKTNAPNINFVISDFDSLISSIPGINAPIVSTKGIKSHEKKDHNSYLVQRGEADIFFPVNFSLVQAMHKEIFKKDSQIVKSNDFVEQFSVQKWAETKSGFNPIKEDFSNTSFLVTSIKADKD